MAAFFDCLNLPTFSRKLAHKRPYTKPIVIFTMASSSESRRARAGLMDGTLLGHVSLLPRQTILEVRKPEFGTALARCCAKNKCWRPEFGPELAAKWLPELSFQQRHDIGSRSSANFWRCWASVGPYLISHLGTSFGVQSLIQNRLPSAYRSYHYSNGTILASDIRQHFCRCWAIVMAYLTSH